tara:strand:+ start:1602 stop:1748 length:147 start_codon:yes stop_codon:yes gene_type:complete
MIDFLHKEIQEKKPLSEHIREGIMVFENFKLPGVNDDKNCQRLRRECF